MVAKAGATPKTPWGKPDLQGIWSREVDIPLERPAKYANQEFFTDEERAELDRQIAGIINRDSTDDRRARGTERDVNTEFAQAPFTVHLPVGKRTSLIVDPPDGKIPPLTPDAQKTRNALRQFQLALLQPTAACKEQGPGCAGGKYGPVSPRRRRDASGVLGRRRCRDQPRRRARGPQSRASAVSAVPFRISGVLLPAPAKSCRAPDEISICLRDPRRGTESLPEYPD